MSIENSRQHEGYETRLRRSLKDVLLCSAAVLCFALGSEQVSAETARICTDASITPESFNAASTIRDSLVESGATIRKSSQVAEPLYDTIAIEEGQVTDVRVCFDDNNGPIGNLRDKFSSRDATVYITGIDTEPN